MADASNTKQYEASGRQGIRVFLEGREVPVNMASVTAGAGSAKTATIHLVPLQIIKFIRPRTQVHIFVRDSRTFGDSNYYLCFEGEVIARRMSKRHDGRALTITAVDYSSYMDDARAFLMNPNFLAGKATTGVQRGDPAPAQEAKSSGGKVINTMANQSSLMVDYLTKFKDSEGNPDLVRGCMEIARQLASVNEFYRSAYERLRVLDRMFIKSSGRIGRLLKDIKVEEYLSSYTGAIGGMTSLRQMLDEIMGLIFHSFVSLPFPSLVPIERSGKQAGYSLAEFLFIPDTYLLPPPKCNVIFPSQQFGFEFSDDFRAAPTRMGFRYAFPMPSDNQAEDMTYPIKYYPTAFADFMYGKKDGARATTTELNSGLGPSKLITGSKGQSYADLFYGGPSKKKPALQSQVQAERELNMNSVGPAYMPTLREADFLTNEESIKGIYYVTEMAAPNYTALVRSGSTGSNTASASGKDTTSRNQLMDEIGKYIFYKKRYGARQVGANIMFNPFIVPGFTALFLDDSEAGQSFIAKVQSISHTFTNDGFITNIDLTCARDFDEIDLMTGNAGDPPLPSWFDPSLYGYTETPDSKSKYYDLETKYLGPPTKDPGRSGGQGIISESAVKRRQTVIGPTVYPQLSDFYLSTIGCGSITEVGPAPTKLRSSQKVLVTTEGACLWLIAAYVNKRDQFARDAFVRKYTQRPVATMTQAFAFIGAEVIRFQSGDKSPIPAEFAVFKGITDPKRTGLPGRFDGVGYSDGKVLKLRRDVIDKYVAQLKKQRGFRG